MKKMICFLAFGVMVLSGYSQDSTAAPLTKAAYLKKSHAQKTAAMLLMGGSLGLFVASVATYEIAFDLGPMFGGQPSGYRPDNSTSTVLAIAGVGSLLSGALLLGSAGKNKKLARAFTVAPQSVYLPRPHGQPSGMVPAVRLRVPL